MSVFWINANAGSGKTTYIVDQIKKLPDPKTALCLTFSNTAAAELNQRINPDYKIAFTLHSFCLQLLLQHNPNYTILNKSLAKILWGQSLEQAWEAQEYSSTILDHIHLLQSGPKNRLYYGELGELQKHAQEIFNQYKTIECLISFDDILEHGLKLLQSSIGGETLYKYIGQVTHLFIDEAQDLSKMQWKVIFALIQELTQKPQYNLHIVGDNKQSIYSFQGACLESYEHAKNTLQEMAKYLDTSFTEIPLNKTYRCPKPICDYVDQVFENKTQHISTKVDGSIDFLEIESMYELAQLIKNKAEQTTDILILIRKRQSQYKELANILNQLGVETVYNQEADLIEYLTNFFQALIKPNSYNLFNLLNSSFLNIDPYENQAIYQSKQKLQVEDLPFSQTFKKAEELNNPLDILQLLQSPDQLIEKAIEYFAQNGSSLNSCLDFLDTYRPETKFMKQVRIQTVHQSKGAEAEIVFLLDSHINPNMTPIDDVDNGEYLMLNTHPDYENLKENKREANLAEHKRLLYVALTRAKQELLIINQKQDKISENSWQAALKPQRSNNTIAKE